MKEPINKYFKVGLIEFMVFPAGLSGEDKDILERVKRIAYDDYFDAIELTWIKDSAARKAVAEILEISKMTVCYGAQPRLLTTGMNPNHLDEAERLRAEATLLSFEL